MDQYKKKYRYCYVPGCVTVRLDENISMHGFPTKKEKKRRNQWFTVLKMNSKKHIDSWRICSKHFLDSDFLPRQPSQNKKILKRNSIPSQNLPGKCALKTSSRAIRLKKRSENIAKLPKNSSKNIVVAVGNDEQYNSAVNVDENNVEMTLVELEDNDQINENPEVTKNKENTLKSTNLITSKDLSAPEHTFESSFIEKLLQNNKDLFNWTGLSSVILLQNIEKCVNNYAKARIFLQSLERPVTMNTIIILVLVKIRVNLTFMQMQVLFNMPYQSVDFYFFKFLPILRNAIKSAIYWPNHAEIKKKLPSYFVPEFEDCIAICDCIEIQLEMPKTLLSRLKYNSKGRYTGKIQITITPHGQIIHVSGTYGGKTSNEHILLNEKVLDNFSENDAIMVDKNYNITKECLEQGIKIYRTPFLHGTQESCSESGENVNTSSCVHFERVIKKIKLFEIFNSKVPASQLKMIDDIMYIACCVINLGSFPIYLLKPDE